MSNMKVEERRNDCAKVEASSANEAESCITKIGEADAQVGDQEADGRINSANLSAPDWPDFEARRKKIWGNRIFSEAEVKRTREAELEGENG